MPKTSKTEASLWDKFITTPQYLIPQHALSVLMHRLTQSQCTWFKNVFIKFIIAKYKVNIAEAAQTDLTAFNSFNAFFTRELREGVRPIAVGENAVSYTHLTLPTIYSV